MWVKVARVKRALESYVGFELEAKGESRAFSSITGRSIKLEALSLEWNKH